MADEYVKCAKSMAIMLTANELNNCINELTLWKSHKHFTKFSDDMLNDCEEAVWIQKTRF